MHTLLAFLIAMLGAAPAMTPFALAQDDIDIPAVAESIAHLKPDQLVTSLHSPLTNDELPAPFSDATFVEPDDASIQPDVRDLLGTVTYTMTYSPGNASTPIPDKDQPSNAGGPGRIYNAASVNYLIFDEQLTEGALEGFGETLRTSTGDQATDAEVQEITIKDQPAYLVSVETKTNGVPIIIDWIAVPVDKVAVVSMTMSGGEAVDRDGLRADAESLSLAAIAHLENASMPQETPAG